MRHEVQLKIIERLLALSDQTLPTEPSLVKRVPADGYTSPAQLEREREVLFRRYPILVAHSSQLREPGDFVTHDDCGVPILVTRTKDGEIRAYLNVCRHRGTRLVSEASGRTKAFVCRYHAWCYDLEGALINVPRREQFPGLVCENNGLVPLGVKDVHGFVWVMPTPGVSFDVTDFLGPIAEDFDAMDIDGHVIFQDSRTVRDCNWKLIVDAFLEGYHVASLHRNSIYRFFGDAGTVQDLFPPHARSVGARKGIAKLRSLPREFWDVRGCATPFYHLFPNVIVVVHPDYISQISVFPVDLGRSVCRHTMLIPRAPETDREREHWEKSFALIDGTVFQREDLEIAESIQSVLGAGANDAFIVGGLEQPIAAFHEEIRRVIAE